MPDHRDYQLFGLKVRSEIPLPDLFPTDRAGPPDVAIRTAALPDAGGEEGLRSVGDALLLTIPGVATYRIANGSEILVDAVAGVAERNVRLFLLGSAFGALLHQRGFLPLHANAVEIDGKAVAFMGESGAGKSTLAAWFHDHGFRVIADDVSIVRFVGERRAQVSPGLPRLRLWRDALERSARSPDGFERSYAGDCSYDKFDVPIPPGSAMSTPTDLAAIVLLERAAEMTIAPLEGMQRVEAVFANTYRGAFVRAVDGAEQHWAASVRLARAVDFYRLSRPWDAADLDRQARTVVEFIRAHVLERC